MNEVAVAVAAAVVVAVEEAMHPIVHSWDEKLVQRETVEAQKISDSLHYLVTSMLWLKHFLASMTMY